MAVQTIINCYPIIFESDVFEKIIRAFFENKWVIPVKYGKLSQTVPLPTKLDSSNWKELYEFYDQHPSLIIYGKNKRFLDFYKYDDRNKFLTSVNHYSDDQDDRDFITEEYNDAIAQVMQLTPGFYAECQSTEAYYHYKNRIELRDGFKESISTVKNIGEGLANPTWKMWFGEQYIKAFGKEKLLSAPSQLTKDYGDIIFINLFENPEEWNTEAVLQRVEAFKQHVGYDYFYDPKNIHKKLLTPDFSDIINSH